MPLESAEQLEAKAACARQVAERLTAPLAAEAMLRVAEYYDMLAAHAWADSAVPPLTD
jgi:hypothetical protein